MDPMGQMRVSVTKEGWVYRWESGSDGREELVEAYVAINAVCWPCDGCDGKSHVSRRAYRPRARGGAAWGPRRGFGSDMGGEMAVGPWKGTRIMVGGSFGRDR